jgi:AbrB family looped-hinge helix DNA binding protein
MDKAGRIVIPKALRRELGLGAGDTLELDSVGEQITLRPVRDTSPLKKEHGVWVLYSGEPLSQSTADDVVRLIREERDTANFAGDE